jgi:hypothetical protein
VICPTDRFVDLAREIRTGARPALASADLAASSRVWNLSPFSDLLFRQAEGLMPRNWTDDDIARLKQMAQKFPTAKIAADLGRSIGATIVKAHELKLSLRVNPDENSTRDPDPGDPDTGGTDHSA